MIVRCLKEFRVLALFWLCAVAAAIVIGAMLVMLPLEPSAATNIWLIACVMQYLLFQLMGVQLFSVEFECGTMPRLLTQPVSRVRIWREKTTVLLFLVLVAVACSMPIGSSLYANLVRCTLDSVPSAAAAPADFVSSPLWDFVSKICGRAVTHDGDWEALSRPTISTFNSAISILNLGLIVCVCGVLSSVCCGPVMALALRQGHTAFWATLVAPMFYLVVATVLFGRFAASGITGQIIEFFLSLLSWDIAEDYGVVIFLLPFFIVTYWLGRRQFMRLEV